MAELYPSHALYRPYNPGTPVPRRTTPSLLSSAHGKGRKQGDRDRPQRIRSLCIPFSTVIFLNSRPKAASIKMPSPSLPSHAGGLAQYAVLYRPGNSGYGSMPGPRRIFLPLKTKLSSFSFFLNSSSLIPLSTLILW